MPVVQVIIPNNPTLSVSIGGVTPVLAVINQSVIATLVINAPTNQINVRALGITTGIVGIAEHVYNEIPIGTINGSNATFTSLFPFIPQTLRLYLNGSRQKVVTHYNTSGVNTIILSDSPLPGEIVEIDYTKL